MNIPTGNLSINMDKRKQEVAVSTCPNWKRPGVEDCGTAAVKLKDEGPVLLAAWPKSNPAKPELELLTLLPNAGAGLPKAEGAVAALAGALLLPNWNAGVALEDGAGAPNAGVLEGGVPNPEPEPSLLSLLPKVKSEDGALTPLLIVGVNEGDAKESFLAGSLFSDESILDPKENASVGLFSSLLAGGWCEKENEGNALGLDALSPNANPVPLGVVFAPLVAPKGAVSAAAEVAAGGAVEATTVGGSLLLRTPKGDAVTVLLESSSLLVVILLNCQQSYLAHLLALTCFQALESRMQHTLILNPYYAPYTYHNPIH
ncbi:hypothetical protein E2C01_007655 [Portunus trituberculatus]|uniref:Uncharacterized protein n=1 Tax=Portunus trituberculatus TaxID=210409 RepID=A0A5B7D029_PORTR|nr:hypothetical protein [Portunus trituberculatus]